MNNDEPGANVEANSTIPQKSKFHNAVNKLQFTNRLKVKSQAPIVEAMSDINFYK